MVLRPIQCGHGALLSKTGGITRAVALNGVDRLGDGFRRSKKSKPPTCHTPRLGEPMNENGMVVMCLGEAGDALMNGAVIEQMLVDFIAHNEHAAFDAKITKRFDFIRSINRTRRIARRVENE